MNTVAGGRSENEAQRSPRIDDLDRGGTAIPPGEILNECSTRRSRR